MSDRAKNYLLDGPLMLAPERKAAMTEQMAQVLLKRGAYLTPGDATLCLHHEGYGVVDIMMLAQDARHAALQTIIAREMSDR